MRQSSTMYPYTDLGLLARSSWKTPGAVESVGLYSQTELGSTVFLVGDLGKVTQPLRVLSS